MHSIDEIRGEHKEHCPQDQEATIHDGAPHEERCECLNIHKVFLIFVTLNDSNQYFYHTRCCDHPDARPGSLIIITGTSGFPAEFLLILSALDTHTGAGLAALSGLVVGAAYFLGIYRRAFLGQAHHSVVPDAVDLRARELGIIVVMGILILVARFYPDSVLELTRTAGEDWVRTLPGR